MNLNYCTIGKANVADLWYGILYYGFNVVYKR